MHPEFARYHRERRRAALPGRIAAALVVTAVLAGGGWAVASNLTAATTQAPSMVLAGQPVQPANAEDLSAPAPPVAKPEPVATAEALGLAAEPTLAPTTDDSPSPSPAPQQHVSITVPVRGFQTELDRCQWVRMDLGAVAPIVGAHNYCDGGVVLDLRTDDLVTITGTGLDGDYQVIGGRDAQAGDDAAAATAGLTADLLLQTCYWDDSGLRLVTLRRVDLSLQPTPAPG